MSQSINISRRDFMAAGVTGVARLVSSGDANVKTAGEPTRVTARPALPKFSISGGLHELGLATPATLVVALHGATQVGRLMITRLTSLADETGAVLLAPDSRDMTWDAIRGGFGADVAFIDRALRWVFDRCTVAPSRVVLAGFSDGATYALALGLANGDLFSRVIAFSPGFVIPIEQKQGCPAIYVSHGVKDPILPIDQCSRRIVPRLKRAGYDVHFDEFDGGHQMPPDIIKAAAAWIRQSPAAKRTPR